MSGKSVIDTPKQFAQHANKEVKSITSGYLPAEDVLIEPEDIQASLRIKYTLQIHMIKRFFDKENVPFLHFFKMATNKRPFFTQYYGKGACGHQKVAAVDNHRGSCLGDYEPTGERLQCPVCKVWFHSNCFFD